MTAKGRHDHVVILGTGCCDSTTPYLYDRHYPGPGAVRVGEVSGVPVFAPRFLSDLYPGQEVLEIDAERDERSDSFSLEAEHGWRLTLRGGRSAGATGDT